MAINKHSIHRWLFGKMFGNRLTVTRIGIVCVENKFQCFYFSAKQNLYTKSDSLNSSLSVDSWSLPAARPFLFTSAFISSSLSGLPLTPFSHFIFIVSQSVSLILSYSNIFASYSISYSSQSLTDTHTHSFSFSVLGQHAYTIFNTNTFKCQQKQTTGFGLETLNAHDRSTAYGTHHAWQMLLSHRTTIRQSYISTRHACSRLCSVVGGRWCGAVIVVAICCCCCCFQRAHATVCFDGSTNTRRTLHSTNRQRQLMFTVCMKHTHQSDLECDRSKTLVERTFQHT